MAVHELQVEPLLSAIPEMVDWVEACCAAAGIGDATRFKMMLVVEEAVANVIRNAFRSMPPPHLIIVRLDIGSTLIVAEVIDNGAPFDPTSAPDPDVSLPAEEREPGGLGILLMRRLMDRLRYARRGDRNILSLEKARD